MTQIILSTSQENKGPTKKRKMKISPFYMEGHKLDSASLRLGATVY